MGEVFHSALGSANSSSSGRFVSAFSFPKPAAVVWAALFALCPSSLVAASSARPAPTPFVVPKRDVDPARGRHPTLQLHERVATDIEGPSDMFSLSSPR